MVDRTRIDQALDNLVRNAVTHTLGGGSHHGSGKPDGTDAQGRDCGSRWTSSTLAPALAPDELPRVFDRFYRADTFA